MKWLVTAAIIASSSSVQAADCKSMFDLKFFNYARFFQDNDFGTVGFSPDNGQHIYVGDSGHGCIGVSRRTNNLRFYFNHRRAPAAELGYVSFKLYGSNDTPVRTSTLILMRNGDWIRAKTAMRAPWKKIDAAKPAPALVSNYEAAYRNGNSLSEEDFDKKFGALHGQPRDSEQNSWDDLTAMQPDDGEVDQSRVAYLAHSLQRVAASPNATSEGEPASFVTGHLEYDELVVHVFSPLGNSSETTNLKFRLTD